MKSVNSTRATTRVTSLLKCFTPDKTELSALEISRISGIPIATTYRILTGLTDSQFLAVSRMWWKKESAYPTL